MSNVMSRQVNWNKVFTCDYNGCVSAYAGNFITFRDLEREFPKGTSARTEIEKLKVHSPKYRRSLARRACNRRNVVVG